MPILAVKQNVLLVTLQPVKYFLMQLPYSKMAKIAQTELSGNVTKTNNVTSTFTMEQNSHSQYILLDN